MTLPFRRSLSCSAVPPLPLLLLPLLLLVVLERTSTTMTTTHALIRSSLPSRTKHATTTLMSPVTLIRAKRKATTRTTTIMLSVPPKDSSSAAESAASPAIVVPSTTNNVHTTNKNHTSISSSSSNNNHSNNNHHHHHRFSIFGQEPSLELAAIVTIYFVQGALGLSRLAQTYLLKDELHLGPAELSAMAGLVTLPWTIKPVYGFLSDGVPLWGYRRKSYLFLAGLVGGWSYALLGWPFLWDQLPEVVVAAAAATTTAVNENNHQLVALIGTMAALVVSSACIAMSDVVADGMVVTRTRETASSDPSLAGALQSLCWGASALGGLMSAYFSGSLLQVMSIRQVFAWTAILPFLVAAIAIGIPEEPVALSQALDRATIIPDTKTDTDMNTDTNTTTETITTTTTTTLLDGVKEQATALWTAFQQPSLWRPALFLFLWQSTPTADGAFFFFLTEDLHLGPEFLGRVRFLSSAASLLGVWLYQQYWRRAKIKDLLFWTTIVSAPLGMIPVLLTTHVNRLLGIPDAALILGDDVVLAALGQIAFLPTLVLAARLCPLGIEAVLFATLMSIFNGASTVGTELGAALTKLFGVTESNFDHLSWLIVFCNLTSLYPLVFINWLDGVGDESEAESPDTPRIEPTNGDSTRTYKDHS